MPRGERPSDPPARLDRTLAAVAVCVLLFGVLAAMRARRSGEPTEPFVGARGSFGMLGSRDAERMRLAGSGGFHMDPVMARSTLEALLANRGYVVGATAETPPRQMPFDMAPSDLEGRCGVVVIIGEADAMIEEAGVVGGATFVAVDHGAFTVAMCGTALVHIEGHGGARTRAWFYPGLTPSMRVATGLSADALLAHAEAEALLRRLGYEPVDEVLEIPGTQRDAAWFATLEAPYRPATGCVPFVA